MTPKPKTPAASGISRLLAAAGFEKAVMTNNSRHVKEHTEGFHVRTGPGYIIVTHWPASTPPTARTTALAQDERRRQMEMLQCYEADIAVAGWDTDLKASLMTLTVYAKAEA